MSDLGYKAQSSADPHIFAEPPGPSRLATSDFETAAPLHDPLIGRFADALRTQLGERLEQLILFGSRARGDHAPDSDYDCLAVVDAVDRTLKDCIFEVTGEFLFQDDAVFAVVPVSEKEFRRRLYNPLFMNVRKEGIVL